jgi:uncharacterized membrane protein (UPF0127 family)
MRQEVQDTGHSKKNTIRKTISLKLLFYALCPMLVSALLYSYPEIKTTPLYIGPQQFVVEIADTTEKHLRGLMFRDYIPDNFGMLFVYGEEEYRSMWMKNCRVHLDIIFLDAGKKIINMYIDVPPCSEEPCRTYVSKKPVKYVLELRGKRAKELKLKPGDNILFILKK